MLRNERQSHNTSATCIESKWRAFTTNQRYLKTLRCAVLIQAVVRRHIARKKFAKIKAYDACRNRSLIMMHERTASITLQQGWKNFKLRALHKSATLIQRMWRAYKDCLRSARTTLRSVIFVQATIRRFLATKRTIGARRLVANAESIHIMVAEREACAVLQRWWTTHLHLIRQKKAFSAEFFVYNAAAAVIVSDTCHQPYFMNNDILMFLHITPLLCCSNPPSEDTKHSLNMLLSPTLYCEW
jgi:hypothetical protein